MRRSFRPWTGRAHWSYVSADAQVGAAGRGRALTAKPAVKRRRRTREQGSDFRNQLIEAARELFVNEGFDAVSIRKIAARAGCPTMTFYVYFKSKRALLHHIWGDVTVEARALASKAVDPAAPASARVRAYILAIVDYWLAHPDSYRVMYMNQDFVEPGEEQYFSAALEAEGRLLELESLIEAGIAEGVFQPADPVEISQVLYSASIGLAHLLITVPEHSWRRETMAQTTFDLLLRGLEKAPASL